MDEGARGVEMTTREIVVDGIRLHVTEAGEGPVLVLLHGLSGTHQNWELTIPAFADRWRVVALDLPGHGRSAKPDAPYTIDFYAGVVRSLGRALGIDEAVVIGNSLGGQIAVEIGLAYPAWARALVLVAPAGGFALPLRALAPVIGAAAAPGLLRYALPRSLARCFYHRGAPGYETRQRLLAERLAHADYPDFARAVARSLAGALGAGDQPIGRLTQPTLLVWGQDDRLVPLSASRRLLRDVPQARLAVFQRCGHLPMLEQASQFNHVVGEFLRAVEAAPLSPARQASGGG